MTSDNQKRGRGKPPQTPYWEEEGYDPSVLTVEQQIKFWRSMASDKYCTGSARIEAFENLIKLIGTQTENNARYVIDFRPYAPEITVKKPLKLGGRG